MPPSPVEDDLALFNEVQNKETESFLLQSKVPPSSVEDDLALFNEGQNKETESFLLQSEVLPSSDEDDLALFNEVQNKETGSFLFQLKVPPLPVEDDLALFNEGQNKETESFLLQLEVPPSPDEDDLALFNEVQNKETESFLFQLKVPSSPVEDDLALFNEVQNKELESFLPQSKVPPSPVEDDLALFNEVQNKETESFLLQSKVNFDDILPTDLISISSLGDSSDLLDAEGDRNDYDWLTSPPETPLFRSLDDESQPQVDLVHMGRPRSQPLSVSQSPKMENGPTSPQRLSSSQHFGNSPFQSRSKLFSVAHSSPPPPKRGLSPSPSKLTPSAWRITSSGSAGTPSPSRAKGPSSINICRGNSSSPHKIKARQSNNIHGFSSKASPNLRTSLADRPVSRNATTSLSPTASRSVGSVASSGDDDLDSLISFPVSRSAPKGVDIYPSNSPVNFSRKPAKSLSRPAPKRSNDLVRQVDRKGPQHMFRPLLSSVPSSTFHAGDASLQHYSPASINSSLTTCSSNASSDLASRPQDTERSIKQNQVDHNINEDTENRIADLPPCSPHGDISNPSKEDALDTTMDIMAICSKCGQIFNSEEVVIKGDPQYCCECKDSDINPAVTNLIGISDRPASNTESINVKGSQHLNSMKEHNAENGSYTASSTSYDDFSYVSNTSVSVSSSVDLGVPIKQIEGQIYRQFSGSKLEMENHRYDMPNTHKGSVSSVATSCHERDFEEFEEKTCWEPCEQSVASESIDSESMCTNIESNNGFSKTQENEETLHAKSEVSINEEEVAPQSSCADMVDIAEIHSMGPMDAISEIVIENAADVISADSHSDVDSMESKSCMDEMHHDEEDITKSVGEPDVPRSECYGPVTEEPRILLDDTGENEKAESRSLTLEEATDAILFCNSIVHNLAYEAANTAINNETFSMEVLLPTSTFLGKPDSERKESTPLRTVRKRRSKTRKAQQKMPATDTKPLLCNADETGDNPKTKSPYIVGVHSVADNSKPPKLESKCNCVIM